jgi:phage tail tape-measure protein
MVASLQSFAARTPFELTDVEKATQRLLAFGFSAKSVIPTLTAVGNASSGLNLGAEGFDRVITALGQIRAKGRLQGDEALQLMEAGSQR